MPEDAWYFFDESGYPLRKTAADHDSKRKKPQAPI